MPIFLSVGYSSCHWCHVMAHESFEDEATAAIMNDRFVNVKVDREERPDVDAVYMTATQALTGRGGWPMSVFLDHDRRPFYAGTYWPKVGRPGVPTFTRILDAIHDAWANRRDEVLESAGEITAAIASTDAVTPEDAIDPAVPTEAATMVVERAWDRELGGFGRAPKFPQAMTMSFLLDHHVTTGDAAALEAVVHTLDAMARGGIHDQVGGGFARYATDAAWLVPHFEKMLYDNALLIEVYARAGVVADRADLRHVAERIAAYLVREMQDPAGGFWSATDADSEGVEGKFFVWTLDEFREVATAAGVDADTFVDFFAVEAGGNFRPEAAGHAPEDANILHEPVPRAEFCAARSLDLAAFEADLDRLLPALYDRREERVHPGLDDKVLTSWNALAIRGLARAGLWLGDDTMVDAATRAARFVRDEMVVDGRLQHTWRAGTAAVPAFLEDVAGMAGACIDLAAATGDTAWLTWAGELLDDAVARFGGDGALHFQTAADAEALVTRPRDTWDNATPSGNSLLASAAWQWWLVTGEDRWRAVADDIVLALQGQVRRAATGFGELLRVAAARTGDSLEVAVVGAPGPDRDALVRAATRAARPGTVLAVADPDDPTAADVPLLAHRTAVDGAPAAYVCRQFACQAPTTDPADLTASLAT